MSMMREAHTSPIPTIKSVRPDSWRGLTSMKAGVITPIAFIPMLREERLRASCTVQIQSEETVHVIVNPVRVRVEAYLVPKTALDRFQGSLEMLNRAYEGEAAPPGFGTAPKWFMPSAALPAGDKGVELLDKLGIHWADGEIINTDLIEAYNVLVNWMRKETSPGLTLAALNNTTCLPAFWDSWRFSSIKPSFDSGQMEGVVPVGIDGTVPVTGIRRFGADTAISPAVAAQVGAATTSIQFQSADGRGVVFDLGTTDKVMVDLSNADGSISLANINTARNAQAMAKLRDRYKSVPDEYLIDLLMAGIDVPDADLRQPMHLASAEAIIGQTERYATDGASLDTSVANGVATVRFTMNTPQINTGGIVLVVCSIVPEQLYERTQDIALHYGDGSIADIATPRYVEDYLDPQKVEAVPNKFIDTRHATPAGVFGYAPLNYRWRRSFSRVGGKFKRPVPDAFVEDRQRIWAVEKTNPALSADVYLCPVPFPHTVFADTVADPYEVITVCEAQLVGSTVFGPGFEEDLGSYDRIIAAVDQTRIDSPDPAVADAEVIEDEPAPAATKKPKNEDVTDA